MAKCEVCNKETCTDCDGTGLHGAMELCAECKGSGGHIDHRPFTDPEYKVKK